MVIQPIPTGIVQPAPAQGGAQGVTLGAVVEHHVQYHFETVAVELIHHVAELGARIRSFAACVPGLRNEVAQCVVAPVVGQPFSEQVGLSQVQVNRQQAQRRDTQALVVRQHGWADHAGIAATQ